MKLSLIILLLFTTAKADIALKHITMPNEQTDTQLTQFAFGSCWRQKGSQGHWASITENHPQFWLWLGDNIYADTSDINVMKKKYQQLSSKPEYAKMAKQLPVLATWDDHDFGKNDSGRDYSMREQSEVLFLDFFNEPTDSPRRRHPGVYTSYYFGSGNQRVQLILLDTRYFRSELKKAKVKAPYRKMGRWTQDSSKQATILGDQQWTWLEKELRQPARFRIIASSIQFAAPYNGYETWANMPLERQKMIDLIKKTRAEGVVFLSGDIHFSELCLVEADGCYPLIDHTSSSLNGPMGSAPTHRRLGPAYGGANFGLVTIDWNVSDPTISFTTKDATNVTKLHHSVSHSSLTFADKNLHVSKADQQWAGTWQTFYGPITLTHTSEKNWSLTSKKRSAQLQLVNQQLTGTWRANQGSDTGSCLFRLSRDGKFLLGAYSHQEKPLQLDWAGWERTPANQLKVQP